MADLFDATEDEDLPFTQYTNDEFLISLDQDIKSTKLVATSNYRWMPKWLPSGFEFAGGHPVVGELGEQPVMMTFTDGLAALTIFVERINHFKTINMSRQKGATSAVVRSLAQLNTSAQITVVGELPLQTLERIAGSIGPVTND